MFTREKRDKPTSTLPPPSTVPPARKLTPEMAQWLNAGWKATCEGCRHHWLSHEKVGETRCPRCGDIPTMKSAFAAIETLPAPAGEAYKRKRRMVESTED